MAVTSPASARLAAAGLQAGHQRVIGLQHVASWRYMNSSFEVLAQPVVAARRRWPAASPPSPDSGSCWAAARARLRPRRAPARWPASRPRASVPKVIGMGLGNGSNSGNAARGGQQVRRGSSPGSRSTRMRHLQRADGVARAAAVAGLAGADDAEPDRAAHRGEDAQVGRLHHDAGVGLLAAPDHGQRAVAADLLFHHQVGDARRRAAAMPRRFSASSAVNSAATCPLASQAPRPCTTPLPPRGSNGRSCPCEGGTTSRCVLNSSALAAARAGDAARAGWSGRRSRCRGSGRSNPRPRAARSTAARAPPRPARRSARRRTPSPRAPARAARGSGSGRRGTARSLRASAREPRREFVHCRVSS